MVVGTVGLGNASCRSGNIGIDADLGPVVFRPRDMVVFRPEGHASR